MQPGRFNVSSAFRRIVKGCGIPERFYLHGDQHEGRQEKYFCRACDYLVSADHFESDQHKNHDRRYFEALDTWDRGIARWKLPRRRANSAPNILAVRAEERHRAAQAARSDFHRWIETQVGRPDPVGDLASEILRDANFPARAQAPEELMSYIEGVASWDGPRAATQEAWREFLACRGGAAVPVAPAVSSGYFGAT